MKTLIIVRHAKSSWTNEVLNDFDRPLDVKGHEEAIEMSQALKAKEINLQHIISSAANRAFTTSKYFAQAFNISETDIVQKQDLYHTTIKIFNSNIKEIDNAKETIAIFSHNPTITFFVNTLTKTQIDELPTCGVFAVQAKCNKWKDFEKSKKEFLFFLSPKI